MDKARMAQYLARYGLLPLALWLLDRFGLPITEQGKVTLGELMLQLATVLILIGSVVADLWLHKVREKRKSAGKGK